MKYNVFESVYVNSFYQCGVLSCLVVIGTSSLLRVLTDFHTLCQSELPRSIPRNSVEKDNGCTSRIYFDKASDNMTLTLNNVTLASQKPC